MKKILTICLLVGLTTVALAETDYIAMPYINAIRFGDQSARAIQSLYVDGPAKIEGALVVDGAVTLPSGAVSLAEMANIATLSVIGRSTAAAGVPEVLSAGTDHHVLRRSGTTLGFGLLGTANLDASAAIAATQLSSGVQTSLGAADMLTRETASAGAILALPEGTNNGTDAVTFAAPAALTGARTITIPDANVTLANIAVAVGKIDNLIDYLSDGLLVSGVLAVDGVNPEKFGVSAISAYTIAGLGYTKAITDQLTFSAANTINVGADTGSFFGIWLVQINAAGTISTLPGGGLADQVYASGALAIAALPAPTAANVALGYILIGANANVAWTANTDDMTAASDCASISFVNATLKTLPAKIE